MVHPSKDKGNRYERELVNDANSRDEGHNAKRAYGSNGESLGFHAEVDLILDSNESSEPWRVQAKRRKSIASHLIPTENVDCVVARPDKGESLAIIPWDTFLELIYAHRMWMSQYNGEDPNPK